MKGSVISEGKKGQKFCIHIPTGILAGARRLMNLIWVGYVGYDA
jgi:hypothetical protein